MGDDRVSQKRKENLMRYALHPPNFADPEELVEMGVAAEAAGWDGFFLWDHLFAGPSFPVPMADPWVVLGAVAVRTERMRLGTAVTPLARRRPQKVARETVTVDQLSGGRMILGVGLGNPPSDEFGAFGEAADLRTISARLDEAIEVVAGLWSGQPFDHQGRFFTVRGAQFLPEPVQRPRIPIWVAAQAGYRAPLVRAARWDGVVLAGMNQEGGVDPLTEDQLKTALRELDHLRRGLERFDIAVVTDGLPSDAVSEMYADLGVTWVLATGWVSQLDELIQARSPHMKSMPARPMSQPRVPDLAERSPAPE
jgi:alkanesulfonate monooxygenase SsuD/methylene tetrahydromethanopterin reductase-like flavin-dependent oxidoreductase (luciferase family)